MPGEMLGDYTAAELAAMPRHEFEAAQARGWSKSDAVSPEEVAAAYAAARTLPEPVTGRAAAAGVPLPSSAPSSVEQRVQDLVTAGAPLPPAPTSGANVWASQKAEGILFTVPSGQTCRIRRLTPEMLLMAGVLDQISSLESLADQLVDSSQGNPPAKSQQRMPSRDEFQALLDLINQVVPLAVSEPKVWGDSDPDAPEGAVRVSDIDLDDRMAIMEKALNGVKTLERFRNAG